MKTIWQLFFTFLKIGTFTFGGGLVMLPVIRVEAVTLKGWMTDSEIADCFAIAQSLPGVLAVNASIYIGNKVKGISGALAAALGVTLPAFVSIILVLIFLKNYSGNVYVMGAFEGIKAATVGLILVTAYSMGKVILKGKLAYLIAAVSLFIIVVLQVSAVWAIVFGGLSGLTAYLLVRRANHA